MREIKEKDAYDRHLSEVAEARRKKSELKRMEDQQIEEEKQIMRQERERGTKPSNLPEHRKRLRKLIWHREYNERSYVAREAEEPEYRRKREASRQKDGNLRSVHESTHQSSSQNPYQSAGQNPYHGSSQSPYNHRSHGGSYQSASKEKTVEDGNNSARRTEKQVKSSMRLGFILNK